MAASAAICAAGATAAHAQPAQTLPLRVVAFSDLHGALLPPAGPRAEVVRSDGMSIPAGGAAYMASYIDQLRTQADHSVLYSVGDAWGSSALESALFHDEPTIDLLNNLDVDAAALGNHEFDSGYSEFRRLREGGCHPVDGCEYRESFDGARFPLLAANVTSHDDRSPAALPYSVDYVDGIPVGVIAVAPHTTPELVRPEHVSGLDFGDEFAAIDRAANDLDALGVRSIVLLFKGDIANETSASCDDRGGLRSVASRVDSRVDLIVASDSERALDCVYPDPDGSPRTVVQGVSHGRVLSVADLTIDRVTRDVVRDRTQSFTQVVTHDIPADLRTRELVDRAATLAGEQASRPLGTVTADITRDRNDHGESALGDLVADAQWAAARSAGAQLALTNPGGLRDDLVRGDDGTVTFGEAYATQPFGNALQVVELTGEQLLRVLDQQFQTDSNGTSRNRILAPSSNVRYRIDPTAERGRRIVDLRIDGAPVTQDGRYRVVANEFLAQGGDRFTAFREGTVVAGAGGDLDALIARLAGAPVAPPKLERIEPLTR